MRSVFLPKDPEKDGKTKKDPLDGNDGQTRVEKQFLEDGCLYHKVKKGVWLNPYTHKWSNFGGDIFHALDGIGICPPYPMRTVKKEEYYFAPGIYWSQQTSYAHAADHKEKMDKNIPVDITNLPNILFLTTFLRVAVGKSSKIKRQEQIRKEPKNWEKTYDELEGYWAKIVIGAIYSGRKGKDRWVLDVDEHYVNYRVISDKTTKNMKSCTTDSFREWMDKEVGFRDIEEA